jgi:hypothetical protein
MTLRTTLTRLLPALSSIRGHGAFRDDLGLQAAAWAGDLGAAAMAEGYDASDAMQGLLALARADTFEKQQLGLEASHGFCDALLDQVVCELPSFEPVAPVRAVGDLLRDMEKSTRSACNVYAIPTSARTSMIETGAELERLVSQDVANGVRPAEHARLARAVHEQIAEVATCHISRRDDQADLALAAIARLAA